MNSTALLPQEGFSFREGLLHAEGVPIDRIAEQVGTPFYLYSSSAMEAAYQRFTAALAGLNAKVFYAMKANSNQAVVRSFAEWGAGSDVVSEGELRRALAAGVPGNRIVFAGVGKTQREMAFALEAGILQFNVESLPELEQLNQVALSMGRTAPVALRVNPNVDAQTHTKIATGRKADKFGIDLDHARTLYRDAQAMKGIAVEGLAVHIGSQLTRMEPFRDAFQRTADFYREMQAAGVPLLRLDLGGGLGVPYHHDQAPDLQRYAEIVKETTAGLGAELAFEPGRYLVASAGLLVTRVVFVKEERGRRFIIVDGAMNDLIRPTLYEAWHNIIPLRQADSGAELTPCDVVGPVCESGDFFAKERDLPPLKSGDLLALCDAGAYGSAMASNYNSRPLVPEVMVRGDEMAVVRPRQDYATMIAQDRLPGWLPALHN
ncbi:diaminopimelate decarboxylase [Limibacillus sp. MBR-115]|jgi:diaminopimelate decarboxylase|uniref:diaminopimelate decarboxylase n=1 Tax=Limibacillus sp. MBR-115 TaxID=3156465 RepID=UPI003398372B